MYCQNMDCDAELSNLANVKEMTVYSSDGWVEYHIICAQCGEETRDEEEHWLNFHREDEPKKKSKKKSKKGRH